MLHAVALEVGDGAVVQLDRHVHDQRALGALERFHPACQAAQVGRDAVHLLQVDAPGSQVLGVKVGRQRVCRRGDAGWVRHEEVSLWKSSHAAYSPGFALSKAAVFGCHAARA
ncbi:hypothetical protein SDC9_188514 [bioreactor metagenome]|uniref:Uncharacterized protein n=1 Tax=bioreactor metagenome TaxID=1076179 RepID=A0A645HXS9_9ZZZZ